MDPLIDLVFRVQTGRYPGMPSGVIRSARHSLCAYAPAEAYGLLSRHCWGMASTQAWHPTRHGHPQGYPGCRTPQACLNANLGTVVFSQFPFPGHYVRCPEQDLHPATAMGPQSHAKGACLA